MERHDYLAHEECFTSLPPLLVKSIKKTEERSQEEGMREVKAKSTPATWKHVVTIWFN